MQAVADVYNENKAVFEDLPAKVDREKEVLEASALMNNEKWGTHHLNAEYVIAPNTMHIIGTGKYALNYKVTVNWDAYVANLKEYCTKRVMWLSDHLFAEKPAGIIVKKQHEGGPVTLLAELTAGTNSTYQWQKSTDGKTWEDIEGATQAKFIPETEEAQYRCVVTGDGVDIVTQHGGRITVKATSVLEPAEVTVKLQKVDGPEEGKLTLVMNAYDMGEYTFAKSGSGWTIQNARGKYLATDGKKVTTSDKPFVWTCDNGVFSASVKVSLTTLGRALRVGKTTTVYLTESDSGRLLQRRQESRPEKSHDGIKLKPEKNRVLNTEVPPAGVFPVRRGLFALFCIVGGPFRIVFRAYHVTICIERPAVEAGDREGSICCGQC